LKIEEWALKKAFGGKEEAVLETGTPVVVTALDGVVDPRRG